MRLLLLRGFCELRSVWFFFSFCLCLLSLFRRKCHQWVSFLWFNTWQQGCCVLNVSSARLPKAHMHQGKTGVKAIVLMCAFVDFLCTPLWYFFFKCVVIFVRMCFHRHVSMEVWHDSDRMYVFIFSKRSVWVDLLYKYEWVQVKDSLLVINLRASEGNRSTRR